MSDSTAVTAKKPAHRRNLTPRNTSSPVMKVAGSKPDWKTACATAGIIVGVAALVAGGVYAYNKYSVPSNGN